MSSAPQACFFQAPTGHRVAYAVHGSGPPLVCTAWWVSHIQEDWEGPGFRSFFGALAEHHTIIRYDRPGSGLSDRERDNVDLASEVAVLGGLIEYLELGKTSLLGISCAGPPSLVYAATHPDRVDRLVFFGSYVDGSHVGNAAVRDALQALVRAHWGMGASALADLFAPDLEAPERKRLGRAQRRAATADMSARLLALTFDAEVRALAAGVQCPALVLHRRQDRAVPFSAGRELAATLPNARLESLEGEAHVPWYGDVAQAVQSIQAFLGHGVASPRSLRSVENRVLVREGDLWSLSFAGKEVHLADARGLSDLAILLVRPGEEVAAVVLWSGGDTPEVARPVDDPVVDRKAMTAYRTRLRNLEAQLELAKAKDAIRRAEALEQEREALSVELRTAVGLGGRSRQHKDHSERARKAVSARLRAILKKIRAVHPELGEHLESSITTGIYCCYAPTDGTPWAVR